MRQGDPPGPLYLVEEGQLRVSRQEGGRRRYLQRLGPGDFFGEMSVFKGRPARGQRGSRVAVPAARPLRRDVPPPA